MKTKKTHSKPWSFDLWKFRFSKPLYKKPTWGFMLQNVEDYAFEFGFVCPKFVVQLSAKPVTSIHVVITAGSYKEEMIWL
jgi:hypothetical protein